TVGRNAPDRQSRSRSSNASSMRLSSSSVSRPARWSTRACAREAIRSYGASRQSNWTLTDRRVSASAGPPSNLPPHSRIGLPSSVTYPHSHLSPAPCPFSTGDLSAIETAPLTGRAIAVHATEAGRGGGFRSAEPGIARRRDRGRQAELHADAIGTA